MNLTLLNTTTLPAEIDLEHVANLAITAAFRSIADSMERYGYPVTGDFAPEEAVQIERAFAAFVGAMALNNPEIAALNEEV